MPRDPRNEVTRLSVKDELRFQAWARRNGITDVDHPDSHYDYRGYWRSVKGANVESGAHFPDTFKQHGHPTFSVESKYSRGPNDGGRWMGETFIPQGAERVRADVLPQFRPRNRAGEVARSFAFQYPRLAGIAGGLGNVARGVVEFVPHTLKALSSYTPEELRDPTIREQLTQMGRDPDEMLHEALQARGRGEPVGSTEGARELLKGLGLMGYNLQRAIQGGEALYEAPNPLNPENERGGFRLLDPDVSPRERSQTITEMLGNAALLGLGARIKGKPSLPTIARIIADESGSIPGAGGLARTPKFEESAASPTSRSSQSTISAQPTALESETFRRLKTVEFVRNMDDQLRAGQGFSLEPGTFAPTRRSGYAVADPDFTLDLTGIENRRTAMHDFLDRADVRAELAKPGRVIGGWGNEINVTRILDDKVEALRFGREGKQQAIGRLDRGAYAEEIPLTPPDAPVWNRSPALQQAMDRGMITPDRMVPSVKGTDGEYYTGINHEDASAFAAAKYRERTPAAERDYRKPVVERGSEGFRLGTGEYVSRERAGAVAREQGLVPKLAPEWTALHSSDINNPGNFAGEYPVPRDLIAAASPSPRVFTSDRLGLPRSEITGLGHSLAHHLSGAADFPGWLASVGQQNPLLGEMLAAAPEAAGKIHRAALGQLPFVQHLQPFSDIMRLYEKGGPGWEDWYGPYYQQLLRAGVPRDVANRVLRSSSILSTQKAPIKEVLTALRAWQARELGEPITTKTTQHTQDITNAAARLIEGQPWADPATFKFGDRQKTSNYVLSELLRGQADAPTLDTWHARAYLGPNIGTYMRGTPPGLGLTNAQWAVMQGRTIADAIRAGAQTGPFQARVWGGITGYDPAYGGVGMHRGHILGQHLASGAFDPLMQRYPGLYGLADEVVPPVGPFEELPPY